MKTVTRDAIGDARGCCRLLHAIAPQHARDYVNRLDANALRALADAIDCRQHSASPEVLKHAWSLAASQTLAANAAAETLAQLDQS